MPNTFIIIKGQPKALQIEQFRMGDNGVYDVKFKSSPRTYHYRYNDVVWLKDAVWHGLALRFSLCYRYIIWE